MEAVALRLALVYELLAPHAAPDHVVVASGGAISHSRAWTQMLADALGPSTARRNARPRAAAPRCSRSRLWARCPTRRPSGRRWARSSGRTPRATRAIA